MYLCLSVQNQCKCFVCRAMSKHAGPRLPAIVECLCPSLNNIYECQRVTVTAFFSEVMHLEILLMFLSVSVLGVGDTVVQMNEKRPQP